MESHTLTQPTNQAHEAGLATLQVACDGYVISNSVIFEYKLPPKEEQIATPEPKVERSNDNLLKFTLLQRLEAMDDRLQIKQEPSDNDVVYCISLCGGCPSYYTVYL